HPTYWESKASQRLWLLCDGPKLPVDVKKSGTFS
ncbi:transcriptional regulator, LysR family, partial [Vibrio parahaemolyticus V-223/04]